MAAADLAVRRLRDGAALALAATSGATDAISFLTLGGAFTSVMTGNLVLLGVSIGHADGALARQIGVAVVGYIVGAAAGARIAGSPVEGEPVWPRAVTRGLAVEAVLFVLYAGGWWVAGGRPQAALASALLALSALALGMQSSTVRRFGVPGLSTTYLTSTLTRVVVRLTSGGHFSDVADRMLVLIALLIGAAIATTVLAFHAFAFVPLVQLLPLGAAVVIGASMRTGPALRDEGPPADPTR